MAIPHPVLGQDAVAFVELTRDVDAEELRAHCRRRIAANKVPSHIYPIEELPHGAYGKVQRRLLLERLAAMEEFASHLAPDRASTT